MRLMIMVAVVLCADLSAQNPLPILGQDAPLVLEIRTTDPALADRGPSRKARVKITPTGPRSTAYLWAEPVDRERVNEVDFHLSVHNEQTGQLVAEDDDSGGGKVPFVLTTVKSETWLLVSVSAGSKTPARSRLHLRVGHETADSLSLARATSAGLKKLREETPSLTKEAVRKGIRKLSSEYLREDTHTPLGTKVARSLALAAWRAQDPATASALFGSVLRSRALRRGWSHPKLTSAKGNYAESLRTIGKPREALPLQEEVLAVRELTLGSDDPQVLRARNNLASTLWTLGDHHRAIRIQEEVFKAQSRTLPDTHPSLQTSRLNLASMLIAAGELDRARSLQETAIGHLAKALPPNHPRLLTARMNLASTFWNLGRLDEALKLEREVFDVRLASLADDHPDLQTTRMNLASSLWLLGALDEARRLQEKVLSVRSAKYAKNHPRLLTVQMNLATTYWSLGDLERAAALQETVLRELTRSQPPEHRNIQTARMNLANTLWALGDGDRAILLQEKAVAVLKKTLPESHADRQGAQLNLAVMLQGGGLLDRALALQEPAVALMKKRIPAQSPDLLIAELNLAVTLRKLGKLNRAHQIQQRVLSTLEGLKTKQYALEQRARMNLATTKAALGVPLGSTIREAFENARLRARRTYRYSTLSRSSAVHTAAVEELRILAKFIPLHDKEDRITLDLTKALSEVQRLSMGDRSVRALVATMAPDQQRHARRLMEDLRKTAKQLTVMSRSGEGESASRLSALQRRDEVRQELDALLGSLPASRGILDETTPKRLSDSLESHQVAVAFFRHKTMIKSEETGGLRDGPERFSALVVRPKGGAELIGLCRVTDLDAAISDYQDALLEEQSPEGGRIAELIIKPLVSHLPDSTQVLCSLDDIISAVPLNALSLEGGLVADRVKFILYPILGDICRAPSGDTRPGGLLALGDPSFDERPKTEKDSPDRHASRKRGKRELHFDRLPATKGEVEAVAALYRAQRKTETGEAQVLLRTQASRQNLLQNIGRPRFIHIASHGYWNSVPELRRSGVPIDRRLGLIGMSQTQQVRTLSPWTLCGLALTGANLPWSGEEPEGRISGEEIAALDLHGCEQVVISACDSAGGYRDRRGGAVYSIQKALHTAGARSVITSLWRVDDEPTRALMTEYYRNLWTKKLSKHEALWQAKMKLRNARRKDGKPRYSVRDWAAWVLTGDPF